MRVWLRTAVLLTFLLTRSATTQSPLEEVRELYEAQHYGLAYKTILSKLEGLKAIGPRYLWFTARYDAGSEEEAVELLVIYGKIMFYNFLGFPKVPLAKAFSAFAMASSQGNHEAQYYLSLLYFYQLNDFREGRDLVASKLDKHWDTKSYLEQRNDRLSFLNLYAASLGQDQKVLGAMANRYIKGLGAPRDCPTATAYMKDAAFRIASEEAFENPKILQTFFLDKEIFDLHISSFGGSKRLKKSKDQVLLLKMKADKGDAQAAVQVGQVYFYGFYGEAVNMTRAFPYFYQAMLKGEETAEAFVGHMYYRGLGVEANPKKAFEIFKDGDFKKNHRCSNGLGLMYLRGDHVAKNLTTAYRLFKTAADAGHPSAQFNLASLVMFRWTPAILASPKLALDYMSLAAHQGHIGAMYAMAVVHLEGYDLYHSCTLSEKLFKAVLDRGRAADLLLKGYLYYQEERLDVAAMFYLEAAYYGYEVGLVNSAILLDKNQIFSSDESLVEEFKNDPVLLTAGAILGFDSNRLINTIYEDLASLRMGAAPPGQRQTPAHPSLTLRASIRLLEAAKEEQNTFATVRLGDYYYYGKGDLAPDLHKAFQLYQAAQSMNKSRDFQAQAYLSTGFMKQFGLGTGRNLALAREDYERASNLGGSLSYVALFAKVLLELEYVLGLDLEQLLSGNYRAVAARLLSFVDPWSLNGPKVLPLFLFALVLSIVQVLRARLRNQMKLLLAHAEEHERAPEQPSN